jgi:acetylornithine deacetylase/succinyl-diaminopimelate desuccinylase-like protein
MTTKHIFTPINWDEAGDEVIAHLRDLLRLDTRNPPGNETRAAEHLQTVLQQEGIECTIVGPHPARGSLIARLRGTGEEKPLLLMSHTDVVAVEPDKWSHPPFSAEIDKDYLYGRGALDMKNMVAMELMTMLLLKRTALPLKRDVIFMAAADEEAGGYQGAGWVAQHHPELIQAEYALNEGGGNGLEINGKLYYAVQAAEKGTARFRLRASGRPGHGSVPLDDNAIFKLATLLLKLREKRLPVHFSQTVRTYLTAIAQAQPPAIAQLFLAVLSDETHADAAIEKLPVDDSFKEELRAQIRNTATPTILTAGSQINVIPSEAEALLDARTLPGWTPEMFLTELQEIFGKDADIEFVDHSPAMEADLASPLFEVIKDVLHQHVPEATPIPVLITGGTDAEHVAQLGTKVYGFSPELYIPGENGLSLIHGHDERIHVHSLTWGARILYEVVAQFSAHPQ